MKVDKRALTKGSRGSRTSESIDLYNCRRTDWFLLEIFSSSESQKKVNFMEIRNKMKTGALLTCSLVVIPLERMPMWKMVKLTTGRKIIPTRVISIILKEIKA